MTQAFNLAQFANNLNTSGQLDATDGLTGLVANANLASSGTASSSTYLRGDRTWGSLPAFGKLLQVVYAAKTNTFTVAASQGTWYDVTGLSASITPSSTTSKILVLTNIVLNGADSRTGSAQLVRNSTPIGNSSTGSGFTWARVASYTDGIPQGGYVSYLDSPSTTSPTTYKIQVTNFSIGGGDVYVNYPRFNPDSVYGVSTITLMEIGA